MNEINVNPSKKTPVPIKTISKRMSGFCKTKDQKRTADISVDGSNSEEPNSGNFKIADSYTLAKQVRQVKPQKKRRKRRDVIFKKILRECRRFFQTKLTGLTGFVASKKPRKDDYMYNCMKKFNIESLGNQGTFEENFYLACLLYPQDLMRNLESFVTKIEDCDIDKEQLKKMYKGTAHKIHDTLYKYSHDKLDFFVSKPELSKLFCYFYEHGAAEEREDPKYSCEYSFIRSKCTTALGRKCSPFTSPSSTQQLSV